MKHIAIVALTLNLGVAGVYAQQRPVKMTFSGSNVATTINLQPGTVTDEQIVAGNGTVTNPPAEPGAFDCEPLKAA